MNIPVKRIKNSCCCNIFSQVSGLICPLYYHDQHWRSAEHCNVVLVWASCCHRPGGSDTELLSWSNES